MSKKKASCGPNMGVHLSEGWTPYSETIWLMVLSPLAASKATLTLNWVVYLAFLPMVNPFLLFVVLVVLRIFKYNNNL